MTTLGFRLFRRVTRALSRLERPLARVPGVAWAYQSLYKRIKPSGLTRIEVNGYSLWVDSADEGVARPILLRGVFEEAETRLVSSLLAPGMRVVDVGANVGYYTVLASRLVGASGLVLAFEPEPSNHELLARNLLENRCENVTALRLAVAGAKGRMTLHKDGSNLGNPSLSSANVPDRAGSVEVEVTTLDAALAEAGSPRIDLLKMDVQGAEGLVLAGAERLLGQDGLTILMELWPRGLENLGTDPARFLQGLVERGYAPRFVERPETVVAAEDVLRAAATDGFVNLLLRRA